MIAPGNNLRADTPAAAPTLGEALLAEDAKANIGVPTPEIDRVQEEVMAANSPEGRPPRRETRLTEWKWFIIGAAVLATSALVFAAFTILAWPIVLVFSLLIVVFLGATSPAWGAGLLRGGEEREARKIALVQTHASGTS